VLEAVAGWSHQTLILAKERWKIPLLLVTALAFTLRVWHLGGRSLWLDEGDSVGFARMQWTAFLHLMSFREVNMVLYYLFLRGWIHLGDSEVFLRIPSVIFGTGAVVATYLFAERTHSRVVALIAATLLSFNVLAIRYSMEVRGYALALMLVSVSWLMYEKAVRRGTRRDLIVWVVISALAVYAHFFAALIFISQHVCVGLAELSAQRKREFAVATAGYFVLISPLILVAARMTQDPLSWVQPLSQRVLLQFATHFFNGGAVQICCAVVLLTAAASIMIGSRREKRWATATAVLGAILPISITLTVSIAKPTLVPRYLLVALPSYVIAVSIPLARLPRIARVAAASVILLLGLPLLRTYEREPAPNDFRNAVAYIAQRAQPGDGLIVWEPLARPAVEYYAARTSAGQGFPKVIFPRSQESLVAEDLVARPELRDIDDLCAKYGRIWIVYNVDLPPEHYFIWHTFFVRRASIGHRMVSKLVIPGNPGVQVLEFERS
jgi:mannosyltransferase